MERPSQQWGGLSLFPAIGYPALAGVVPALSPNTSIAALTTAGRPASGGVRAPAMIKMSMIITRHAGRRRTS
jgi:hypothetical protein